MIFLAFFFFFFFFCGKHMACIILYRAENMEHLKNKMILYIICQPGECGVLVVTVLECRSRGRGFNPHWRWGVCLGKDYLLPIVQVDAKEAMAFSIPARLKKNHLSDYFSCHVMP